MSCISQCVNIGDIARTYDTRSPTYLTSCQSSNGFDKQALAKHVTTYSRKRLFQLLVVSGEIIVAKVRENAMAVINPALLSRYTLEQGFINREVGNRKMLSIFNEFLSGVRKLTILFLVETGPDVVSNNHKTRAEVITLGSNRGM